MAARRSSAPTASCRSACSACAPAAATTTSPRRRRPPTPSRRRRRCSRCAAPMATARRRSTTLAPRTVRGFNRWNAGGTAAPVADIAAVAAAGSAAASGRAASERPAQARPSEGSPAARCFDFPVAASSGRAAYVAGTFDTKGRELVLPAPVPGKARPARRHGRPRDLGQAVARQRASARGGAPSSRRASRRSSAATAAARSTAMALAFERFVQTRRDLGGLHLGRRLRRHLDRHRRACARCRSACPR